MSPPESDGSRPPGVAGLFYPQDPAELSRLLERLLNRIASVERPGKVRGLVLPHAGYAYSGEVAAAGCRLLEPGEWDAVVVVGPSHLETFPGTTVYPGRGYRTPLGECPLDRELVKALLERPGGAVRAGLAGHWQHGAQRQEHAVEVELPFLQHRLDRAIPIVPLVMGERDWEQVRRLGEALYRAVSRAPDPARVLLVASSDLSHFHPADRAERIDRHTLELIEGFDVAAFYRALQAGEAEACGGAPVAAVMLAAAHLGARGARTVAYAHSGAVAERDSVVGYGAVWIG